MRMKLNDSRVQYVMVLGSNGVVILLGFLLSILCTRTMPTESYGFYKAFTNGLATIVSLVSMGFSLTFAREFALCAGKEEKRTLAGAAYVVNFSISLITFLVMGGAALIAKPLGIEIPAYLVLASAFVWVMLLHRYYKFRFQGENNMLQHSLFSVIPVSLLAALLGICLLLGKTVTSATAIIAYLSGYLIVMVLFFLRDIPSFKGVRENVRRIWKTNLGYGLQLHIGSLVSVTSANILNLLVAPISGLEEYAFFSLGLSMSTPVRQVPAVMGTISFKKNVKLDKMPKGQILLTFLMTAAGIAVYTLFLKFVMIHLVGKDYGPGISYATILVYYEALMGLGDFFNRFVIAKGNSKDVRNSAFVTGIALIVSAACLMPLWQVKGLILAETFSGIVYLALMIRCYVLTVKNNKNEQNPIAE